MNYFKQEESILNELTALYESRGYKKYKPTSFEEYSLYLENRDFLISKNVITFSDVSGKLMALRPDVTLSIVKHSKADEGTTEKLFYNEKVYRQQGNSKEFKEISQTGVEIIGNIDDVCQAEMAILILDTLKIVSDNYLLDISSMGFTEGLISSFNLDDQKKEVVYDYLRNKNIHDFEVFAKSNDLTTNQISAFKTVIEIGGNAKKAIASSKNISINAQMVDAINELERLVDILNNLGYGEKLNINFSIANNADYYNGIIFNGYIGGVPKAVLSGGRYDKLLEKFGKKAGAIGFALYIGELERYFQPDPKVVDYLVIYDDATQYKALNISEEKVKAGSRVRLSRSILQDIKYKNLIDLTNGGNN
jgi:ATP phosphoribosyltransferase regulatory subunit